MNKHFDETDSDILMENLGQHITKSSLVTEKLVISDEKEESISTQFKRLDTWGFSFDMPPMAVITVDKNKIYYNGEVCSAGINTLIEKTRDLQESFKQVSINNGIPLDSLYIELYITSPGGSVTEGFRYIDYVEKNKIHIKTIAFGTVASMGFVLWLIGNDRYIGKHSHILIHQMSSGFQGKRSDILDYLKHLEDIQNDLMGYIAERTGYTIKKVEDLTGKETWLTANEVVSLSMGKIWE